MQPTNLKEQQAKDVYNKVFAGQDKQRNPCSVAICCKVFFTKTNKPTQQTHIEVITLSEFKKKFGVRTETEFLLWARDCTSPQGVRLNAQDCSYSSLKSRLQELSAELGSLDSAIKKQQSLNTPFQVGYFNPSFVQTEY